MYLWVVYLHVIVTTIVADPPQVEIYGYDPMKSETENETGT